MGVIAALLRWFSYLFHLLLTGFLLGLSTLSVIDGRHNLRLEMLPWEGEQLTYWLLGLSLFGLMSLVLAVLGKLRLLFALWCLIVFGLMVRGYFLSPYSFQGMDEFRFTAWLTGGALLALIGSLTGLRKRRRR